MKYFLYFLTPFFLNITFVNAQNYEGPNFKCELLTQTQSVELSVNAGTLNIKINTVDDFGLNFSLLENDMYFSQKSGRSELYGDNAFMDFAIDETSIKDLALTIVFSEGIPQKDTLMPPLTGFVIYGFKECVLLD